MTIHGPLAARGQIGRALATAAGGAAFVGAYDAFAASLAHVYEPARRTLTSYIGDLCRLRRASDNAERDWGYLVNGDLNVAGITAWLGGANGYVVSVYDQVAGDTITQADITKQPLYVANARNGHAGPYFDGTNDYLQGAFTTGGSLSQPFHQFAVAKNDAPDNFNRYILDGDNAVGVNSVFVGRRFPAATRFIYSGVVVSGGALDSAWRVWSALFNGASSELRTNGALEGSGNAGTNNSDGITIGARGDITNFYFGYIPTVIVCDPSLGAGDRAAMETAINAYWVVY